MNPEYVEMARQRIEGDERLFSEPVVTERIETPGLFDGLDGEAM